MSSPNFFSSLDCEGRCSEDFFASDWRPKELLRLRLAEQLGLHLLQQALPSCEDFLAWDPPVPLACDVPEGLTAELDLD